MNQKRKLLANWYWILTGIVILGELAVFLFYRQDSYLAVHDNLDLFIPQLKMLKDNGSFFSHGELMPMLGGVSRDKFGSELCLYNLLYFFLDPFAAYLTGYFLKILLALCSFLLLGRECMEKEAFLRNRPFLVLTGLAYGLAPVFPAYGLAFASIPLIVFLLVRIYRRPQPWLFLAVFLYPFLSYFSYFGIFLLGYLLLAVLIVWARDRKFPKWLALAFLMLAAGNVVFEYRLFGDMLFSGEVSMRAVMADTDLNAAGIAAAVWDVFRNGIFHAQASHTWFILPVCAVYFVWNNINYIRRKDGKGILKDGVNLLLAFLLFNSLIYGFYYWGGLRRAFEALVPPLKGFQYSRTVFFNPFLWYAALFLICRRLAGLGKQRLYGLACALAVTALAVVILTPAVYNDFYATCYDHAYELVKGKEPSNLSYREFYSEKLFDSIKEEIGYQGENAVAYGMHPAVLQYNGIHTLDGYLGFYSLDYKQRFRQVVAPALERVEEWRLYFDDWGARAYIFSGDGTNTWDPVRWLSVPDTKLYIDGRAFQNLGGVYVFSRIEISNVKEAGLVPAGVYTAGDSPYTIYLYRTAEKN